MFVLVRGLHQNCTDGDVLAVYCLHEMMDLYSVKPLVMLVPNMFHLVFTVAFILSSNPMRDNILSRGEKSALECVPRVQLIEHRYLDRWNNLCHTKAQPWAA